MLRVVPAAGPLTPSTVGFGDDVSIVAAVREVGGTPLFQFVPTVQSVLVVPVQV
jgi:hypothetical protein